MHHTQLSRRRFAQIAATAGVSRLAAVAAKPLTAEMIVRRIQTELGGDWPAAGTDGFTVGDPSTVIRSIATTAMATLDVLKEAVKEQANLILTYEPTFYGRADGRVLPASRSGRGPIGRTAGDPIARAKREFIETNGLVVFRLRDHWQTRQQNDMVIGLAAALGWSSRRVKRDDDLYDIPVAAAHEIVERIRIMLKISGGLRAVGDRNAAIRRVLLHPGAMTTAVMWQRYSEVDMIVAGEVREWENTFYAADIFTAGEKRVLVTVGRVVSEDPGMRACAAWLNTVVTEVPAKWIGAGDPYWRPV